jgi:hypothetical protein
MAMLRSLIGRNELVHQPIVRRPAHPRRLVGVLVIGRVAAKPQAQLASAPEGSVKLGLSLGGVGKLISAPRPKVTAANRQAQTPFGSSVDIRTTTAGRQTMAAKVQGKLYRQSRRVRPTNSRG